jgi:hypothetical protein
MDMGAAARAGISFYTHKATEGTSTQHHPGPSLAAARDAGIPFLGAYLVPRSGPSVAAQVDYFLSWMDSQAPWWKTFRGWFWQVDTEHWSYDAVTAQRGHDVAQLLAARTGRVVLHYAPEWAYGNGVPAGEALWASSYVSGSGTFLTLYPGDGSSHWHAYSSRVPAILQYTSSATIGRQPGCDANAFRGTTADFAKLIGRHDDMAQVITLAKDGNGQYYVCDGMVSRPIPAHNLGDIRYAAGQGSYTIARNSSVEWIEGGDIRSGWAPEVFGAVPPPPAPAPVPITDAQLDAVATKLANALVASNANGLTEADLTAVKALVADELAGLTLHAG